MASDTLTSGPDTAPESELLAIKIQRARLLERKLEILRRYGLPFYRPTPKQDLFHRANRFKRRMVRAGNRFGKSTLGCAEDCAWLMNERPWYPKDDPARRGGIPQRPVKILTITTDWDKVDEIWTGQEGKGGKVWSFLPKDGFVKGVRRNHSGAIDTIECANQSLWRFDTVKSFKANPLGTESSDWDAIHVDEPCPQGMWIAASRGLIDRGGSAWFTLTPLSEQWINDIFFPDEMGTTPRESAWAITASMRDNTYLTEEAIQEYIMDLTEEERQCRIDGIPLHLSGLIYKDFQWGLHVLDELPKGWADFEHPPKTWPVYVAIDPHPRTPHAVLMCTVDPFGRLYFFKDLFHHCSIENLVKGYSEFQGILPALRGYRIVWTKMDPLGFIEDPITMSSMALETEKHGLFVEKATKALAEGILKVQGRLRERDCDGRPTIYFTPSARRTLWEIRRYSWDDQSDKPVDENDHMMENLYRLVLSEPRWIDFSATRDEFPEVVIDRPQLDLPDFADIV